MFNQDEIIEFIKRIIEKEDDGEKAISLIEDFKETLELVKMADSETLKKIDIIIKKLPARYELDKLLNKEEPKTISKRKKYENRHYNNYHTSGNISSACGGSSSYSNISSACGGGSSSYSSWC